MPKRLANLVRLAERETRTEILPPQVFPAQGARRMRVLLLAGCAQQALDGEINAATIRVLTRHGCEVVDRGRRRLLRRAAVAYGARGRGAGAGRERTPPPGRG